MKKVITTLLCVSVFSVSFGQWKKTTFHGEKFRTTANDKEYYTLDLSQLRSQLSTAKRMKSSNAPVEIALPSINGKLEKFDVYSFPVVVQELADQYQLGSYYGVSKADPTVTVRFSVAPNDFQSMLFRNGVAEFIESANTDKTVYGIHYKTGKSTVKGVFCSTQEPKQSQEEMDRLVKAGNEYVNNPIFAARSSDKKFRTLRLVVSTTAEYTAFFGGVEGALAQINATITRVNGVFEKEFGLHMDLQNYPSLIYTNASTDPYSSVTDPDQPPSAWNRQLMNTLHSSLVGDANFDLGHLFGASGGGGNAGCIGCVCDNTLNANSGTYGVGYKGAGITSPATGSINSSTVHPPSGDGFDIDYVAHEMGHQLGDYHTYSWYEGNGVEAEPGSGSTIMGYAGITGTDLDVQSHSDPYFHGLSIAQIQTNLSKTSKTCDVETAIDNSPPVITALPTYTIPKSTAFALTAIATDTDPMTYSWEEVDKSNSSIGEPWGDGAGISNNPSYNHVLGTTTSGATFRSLIPSSSPTRYFPTLGTVLGGAVKNLAIWESTSSIARTTNFRVTVRDLNPVHPQTAFANQVIVVGSAEPFTVSTTSLPSVTSPVAWVVSGTNVSPYNVTNVKIDFTADNGATWTTLAASVPNTGNANVVVPSELSGKSGHIRVSAIGNVFYAVNKVTIATLAVSDINKSKVQVYPNPATDILNVSNVSAKTSYKIFSITGQLVSTGNINNGEVNVSQLTKGVYIISFEDNATVSNIKFEKK